MSALKTINQAITTVGEDSELTAKAEEYENMYVIAVTSQVDALIAENKIDDARTLLEEASKEVPSNQAIKTRLDEINTYKTIALDTLTPINGEFTWNQGVPEDPFGSDYSTVKNFAILSSFSYETSVEYKIDQQYDVFEFDLSPYVNCGQENSSYVMVYVDNALRYVSPMIVQKSGIINVSVDVKDATYLKIVIRTENNGYLMISDAILTSVPNYESSYKTGITSVATLKPLNGGFNWDTLYPTNNKGDLYMNIANYTIFSQYNRSTYVEYYLGGKYKSLSFDMAPYLYFDQENGKAIIKIYVDDALVYTGTLTQKSEKISTGSINVANAKYLKITIETENSASVILSDVILENAE